MYGEIPKHIKEYISKLDGISYSDWCKLSATINEHFKIKTHNAQKELSIVCDEVTYYAGN